MKLKRTIRLLFEKWIDRLYYNYHVVRRRRKGSEYELKQWAGICDSYCLPGDVKKSVSEMYYGYHYDERWLKYYGLFYEKMKTEKKFDLREAVPSDFFYQYVDPCFCDPIMGLEFSDKNFTDLLFPDVCRPKTVVRYEKGLFLNDGYNIISENEALRLCENHDELVIKPSARSGGGKGVLFWKPEKTGVEDFPANFKTNKSYVVQELVRQHPLLSKLHSESLNTIRLITFLWKGEVVVLSSFIRMGVGGSKIDNAHAGGIFCGIEEDGSLQKYAVDYKFSIYETHPQGTVFQGFVIPNYNKCVEMVKKIAPRMARIAKMISWDVAINEDGEPVLLESNMMYNGVDAPQIVTGPIFGDRTEEIIQYVKEHQRTKFNVI